MPASRPPRSDDVPPAEGRAAAQGLASGEPLDLVVGRVDELSRIDRVLAGATDGRPQLLLVEGEPGVGKTTLLRQARARAEARGFTCLAASGTESDSGLAYAGLLGLLHPLRALVDGLPGVQAGALRAALGWTPLAAPADRFLVGAATLSLLALAAEQRPVLVLVDDLQWLDRESADAVVFASRRLGPDAVGVLLAARTGSVAADLAAAVPVLPLGGISTPDAAALLPPDVAPTVVERLVTETEGNPMALLEVARRLDAPQRTGAAPLPDPLPSGGRLLALHDALLAGLSPGAQRAVLLVALSSVSGSDQEAVVRALDEAGLDAEQVLGEAVDERLLVRSGDGYALRHPLLRTAVLRRTAASERRSAHAALARALPASDRAHLLHRADATAGTDRELADDLTRLAAHDRDRLGHDAASLVLEHASALTADVELAAERLAAAAHDAFVAGDVARVRSLVDRVVTGPGPDQARGEAWFTLGMLEQYAGSVPRSAEHLAVAADLLSGPQLVRALTELALARFRLGDVAGFAECAGRADAAADLADPEQALLAHFVGGASALLTGDLETGRARLAEVPRLADSPGLRHDARALLLLALSAGFTGDVAEAVRVGAPRLEEVRRRGAIGVLVPVLAVLAAGRAWLGDHAAAFADAGEAAELAGLLGYAADAAVAVEMLAWQSAARDLHEDARAALAQARELTDRAGTTTYAAHQALTAAFCALCSGDLDEVVRVLEQRIATDGGVGSMGEPLGVAPLLVEAYVGLGRREDARALTVRLGAETPAGSPALTVALLRRCEAVTADDEEVAEQAFAAAMDAHRAGGDPFEAARTRLLHGSRLRRAGRRVEARAHLAAAHDAFESMQLSHWSDVAAQELAGTGAAPRRRGASVDEPLTSQETRVALLAARGQSNREIGASLFLSPKTVEHHLTQVFRKRGFRSRTELAAAFAREPAR